MNRRSFVITAAALFVVLFNLGYVFHDLLLGEWFHHHERAVAREHFIIPLVAVSFAAYALVLAYLFPIYRRHYATAPLRSTAIRFGILMGFVWDALQGGLIEIATFKIPFVVFVVDSGYHVLVEGTIAGLILATVERRWPAITAAPR